MPEIRRISETSVRALLDLQETGMGFQIVTAHWWPGAGRTPWLVLDTEHAIPLDDPEDVLSWLIYRESTQTVEEWFNAAPAAEQITLTEITLSFTRVGPMI